LGMRKHIINVTNSRYLQTLFVQIVSTCCAGLPDPSYPYWTWHRFNVSEVVHWFVLTRVATFAQFLREALALSLRRSNWKAKSCP